MARHHGVAVEVGQRLERSHPLRGGALPADGRALVEQQVAGEHDAQLGQVDGDVAGGVGRPEREEPHLVAADVEGGAVVVDEGGRRADLDAGEVVGRQRFGEAPEVREGASPGRRWTGPGGGPGPRGP